MYSIADYANMMADAVRMNAYADALRRSVNTDSVVVDLGSGTGAFAMLAAQFGARKVYAIEPDDAIHLGKAIAVASGLADRVEFVQAASTEAMIPERADVIVSDIRGVLPLFGRHIPSIADARTRLLATSGILIPRCDRIRAAIVEAPEVYERHVAPWCERSYGLDLRPARDMLSNTWRKVRLTPQQILTDSQLLAVLDYRVLDNPNLDVTATWTARRMGVGHGLCIWFDAELTEDVAFSNAPGEPAAIYGQAFFPFAVPASLGDGESISVRIRADLTGDDYVWQWSVEAGEEPDRRRSRSAAQSTLHGVPFGVQRLKKGASSHVPTLTTDGEIDCFVLSRMQAAAPLGDIARELLSRFPAALRDWNDALGRVGELSRKYSKD